MGHEIAGEVVEVAAETTGWEPGDRAGVHPLGETVPGYSRDGVYAAFTVVPATDLVRAPDDLPYDLAAIGTDAGMTSHQALVEVARVGLGTRVGVIGLGGLGQIGAQIAVLLGAEVHATDRSPVAMAAATGWGLTATYSSAEEVTGLGLEAVVDFAGFGSTTEAAEGAIEPVATW